MRDTYTFDNIDMEGKPCVRIRLATNEDIDSDTFPSIRVIIDLQISRGYSKENILLSSEALNYYIKGLIG